MKIILAFVALVALALFGSRRVLAPGRLPLGTRMAFLAGIEFLLVGLLLGSSFLNVIDASALTALRPFLTVALGWIGFLFGLQFERHALGGLPAGLLGGALVQAVLTSGLVFVAMWLLLHNESSGGPAAAIAAAALAASAACSGQSILALMRFRFPPARRRIRTALGVMAGLDPAVGVILLGVALALFGQPPPAGVLPPWAASLGLAICFGCLTAWIFVSLTLTHCTQAELLLYLLGTLALASGVALFLDLSAILVTFICGVVVANLARVRTIRLRAMELMVGGERFIYLVLLILVGALWKLPSPALALLAAAYFGIRLLGKLAGGAIAARFQFDGSRPPYHLGLGLVSQAGMGVAILVDYALGRDEPLTTIVLSIGLLAILANELVAPRLITWVAGPVSRS